MSRSFIVPAIVVFLAACAGEPAANTEASSAPAETPAKAPSTATAEAVAAIPDASRSAFVALIANYQQLQGTLADDSVGGVATAATAAATAARQLESTAVDPKKIHFTAIATAAEALAANAGELTVARRSFGELSKALIGLMVASPELGKGFVVVECPMTSNYKKWLQTDETVRNPHYGKTMLECGTISELEL